MARYIKDFQIIVDSQIVHAAVTQYLQSEGYEYINYDGESVFKKGNGVMVNPSFFKLSYHGNIVRMETWMKYVFFPGVYIGELGVDGFCGFAVKRAWKNRIKNMENILSAFAMQSIGYLSASAQTNKVSMDDNETQLLNDNIFEKKCLMNENDTKTPSLFCTSCGSQMLDGAAFCSVCGKRRINVNTNDDTYQNFTTNQQFFSQTNNFNNFDGAAPISRREFINKYVQPSLRKNITGIAILCYVCSGLTFIVSCLFNPVGIIDALVLFGLALGMHLAKSKLCAVLILILSIIEVIISLTTGKFPFWWLIAGISAVVTFSKIDKQYKLFQNK